MFWNEKLKRQVESLKQENLRMDMEIRMLKSRLEDYLYMWNYYAPASKAKNPIVVKNVVYALLEHLGLQIEDTGIIVKEKNIDKS